MMTADAVRVTTTEILEGKLRLDLLSAAVASGVVTENLGSGHYVPLILAWTLELTSPTAHMCCSPAKERRAADAKAGCCRRQSERLRHEFRNLLGRQRSEGARHSPRSADRAKASRFHESQLEWSSWKSGSWTSSGQRTAPVSRACEGAAPLTSRPSWHPPGRWLRGRGDTPIRGLRLTCRKTERAASSGSKPGRGAREESAARPGNPATGAPSMMFPDISLAPAGTMADLMPRQRREQRTGAASARVGLRVL